ncbi:hypothetical protein LELG_02578 [Lodderomyces elongisporus NRRL YB-4239]|uniref:RecA family profile 1 domain-containing protein n=1 Tax=Lodderomyces elongisporus (strain ATCC 11503 / CBS 2605 / JCM 1781 / NBRC 1676 / NRRL YB-4239) TaxID=379508 RepID=A5DYZ1_LODEL|nr:hypothetical protein LELG_02578 [Lodderomyces elongisporus NRRL YB-4239]
MSKIRIQKNKKKERYVCFKQARLTHISLILNNETCKHRIEIHTLQRYMDDYKQIGHHECTSSQKFPFLVSLLQLHGKFVNDVIEEPSYEHEEKKGEEEEDDDEEEVKEKEKEKGKAEEEEEDDDEEEEEEDGEEGDVEKINDKKHATDISQELAKLLSRPVREIKDYIRSLNEDLAVPPSNIDNLFGDNLNDGDIDYENHISTGLPDLDEQLGGGIPIGEVSEVFGASGCGKSQFVYQIIHNSILQGAKNTVVHVATESFMESKRLKDIFESDSSSSSSLSSKLDRMSYIYCPDLETQDHILFTQLPIHLQENIGKTKLLVIDSIAQHFRREDAMSTASTLKNQIDEQVLELAQDEEFKSTVMPNHKKQLKLVSYKSAKYATRSTKLHYLCQMYRHLARLARQYNIAVVIINQVSAHTNDYDDLRRWENAHHEELVYPLNYDFQTLVSAGWDPKVISKYLPATSVRLNERDIEHLEMEISQHLDPFGATRRRKRRRTDDNNENNDDDDDDDDDKGENNINNINNGDDDEGVYDGNEYENKTLDMERDPRYNKVKQSDLLETRKDLILKAHEMRNKNTKKLVPTLGYPWSVRIQNRIMLMKTYKPILKLKSELEEEEDDKEKERRGEGLLDKKVSLVDPDSGLTYAQLCEGFNTPTSSSSGNQDIAASLLLKGWQVQRFARVVQSSHNHGSGPMENVAFEIRKEGLAQMQPS